MSSTYPCLIYANDVNLWSKNIDIIKNSTKSLLYTSHETGLDVNSAVISRLAIKLQDKITKQRHLKFSKIVSGFEWTR